MHRSTPHSASGIPPSFYKVKIRSFLALPAGWHHGEGEKLLSRTVETALDLAQYGFNSALMVDAAPGLDGSVQVVLYRRSNPKDKYIEITVEPSQQINITQYRREDGRWAIAAEKDYASIAEAKPAIDDFKSEVYQCLSLSEFSQKDISSPIWVDSPVWPSAPIVGESLSLMKAA